MLNVKYLLLKRLSKHFLIIEIDLSRQDVSLSV